MGPKSQLQNQVKCGRFKIGDIDLLYGYVNELSQSRSSDLLTRTE
jgi:hypothetical protein